MHAQTHGSYTILAPVNVIFLTIIFTRARIVQGICLPHFVWLMHSSCSLRIKITGHEFLSLAYNITGARILYETLSPVTALRSYGQSPDLHRATLLHTAQSIPLIQLGLHTELDLL